MPLFKAKIVTVSEIPVFAKTEKEALEYLKSTREWMDDASLTYEFSSTYIDDVAVVTDPKECEFDHDVLCWNARETDITALEAFHDERISNSRAYEENWRVNKNDLIADFNRAQSKN